MFRTRFDPKKVYRYDLQTGTFYIDIKLDDYHQLCNEWDFSPQTNRDLDEDLLEYLCGCCAEIPNRAVLEIIMNLPEKVYDPGREERARSGFRNFFAYLIRREKNRARSFYQEIIKYLFSGALLLVAASLLEPHLKGIYHGELLAEGLIIGAWVSIWEVFSVIFFKLSEHRRRITTYHRLLNAGIGYRYLAEQPDDAPSTASELNGGA